jgi:Na+/H+-dicarboxylate symporter
MSPPAADEPYNDRSLNEDTPMSDALMRDAARQTKWILIALVAGAATGIAINLAKGVLPWLDTVLVDVVFKLLGDVFRNGLMLLVVPLVFFSLTGGVASLRNLAELGRVGGRTLVLYVLTTVLAVSMALGLALFFKPGADVDQATTAFTPPAPPPPLLDQLIAMVPTNPVQALATMNMLQIIVFSILLGTAILMAGEPGQRVRAMVDDVGAVVMKLVTIVMLFAPVGVFALLARAIADLGFDQIIKLIQYFLLVLGTLLLQLLVVFPLMLRSVGGLDPRPWLRKMREVWLYAFSTSSSNATLPVTMRVVEQRLGASNRVASFTIPLGATVNMNGTAIMQGIACVFIAQLYGIDLTLEQLLTVVGMATVAAIGTAGVPSAGIVMLAAVLSQVGLPVDGIGLILAVDRLLDMTRTVVNVSGDAAVSIIVAHREGELDMEAYRAP